MTDIVMPQLGESVTEGTITRWFKAVGETVTEDEPLFEVSTDKVDTEVPAPCSGVLAEIRVAEGNTVDVGTVLAVVGGDGAAPAAAPAPEAEPAPAPEPEPAAATEPEAEVAPASEAPTPAPAPAAPAAKAPEPAPTAAAEPAPAAPAPGGSGHLLSPLVRRLVEEHGLDPNTITGTGVGGRITRGDVLAAIDAGPSVPSAAPVPSAPAGGGSVPPAPPAPSTTARPRPQVEPIRPGSGDRVEPLNNIRRVTGDHMVASKNTAPHVATAVEVDYEGVERARRAFRDQFAAEEGFSLTYLPFIARAVVDALHEFPHMNASMGDGSVILHSDVHLGIAVDLNFNGLLAPVIRNAHDKRLRAIARDVRDLATRARAKNLGPDDLAGGTFTISNSGNFGTLFVTAVINQPQVAILSSDGISRRPVVVRDALGNETIGIHSVGVLTLSWDHRAFDGAYAAAFVDRVREIIETRDWLAEF
ncbi:MAG: 2-oxoglutarate dehydrogenase, E2 component, dihydrolipoamide succinyltransferase [Actinomycetes bacterium]